MQYKYSKYSVLRAHERYSLRLDCLLMYLLVIIVLTATLYPIYRPKMLRLRERVRKLY